MLLDFLSQNEKIKAIITDKINSINQTNANFNIYTIASDYKMNNRMLFVILPNLSTASYYYDSLINLVGEEDVLFFPADEVLSSMLIGISNDFKYERINTIYELLKGNAKIVVTNLNGVMQPIAPKDIWSEGKVHLHLNMYIEIPHLKKKLIEYGYEQVYTVYKTGQFAQRGHIIDIFPLNYTHPVRLDFFDIEVEQIRFFNPDNQISFDSLNEVTIIPINEFFYNDEVLAKAVKQIKHITPLSIPDKEKLDGDLLNLENRENLNVLQHYIKYFYNCQSILNFYDDAKIYISEFIKMKSIFSKNIEELEIHLHDLKDNLCPFLAHDLTMLEDYKKICFMEELIDIPGSPNAQAQTIQPYNANFRLLSKEIKEDINIVRTIVVINDLDRLKRLKEFFLEEHINYQTAHSLNDIFLGHVSFILQKFALPIYLPKEEIKIITENLIYSNTYERKKIKYKSVYQNALQINKFQDLKIDDYVVHYNYGIGIYKGIKTIDIKENKGDYIMIAYYGTDVLYIPVEQIDLVHKYSAKEGFVPTLSRLNSGQWDKTKERVKNRIREFSDRLIKLYAQRDQAKGYAYPKDSSEQSVFEADFEFEETLDQLKAIVEVKADMESERPMDRLICGDVGFGKTEVALRAAFKAVMAGKQVAYLAPTTVLARQHYHTFKKRMEEYGVAVELISRFVGPKRQQEILENLKKGMVDILVGTHRLLSGDIIFRDLGLLITDEEQRFGVIHKEKIKEMKVNVDSLMLTATPIPRTLQMSLMGIKGLSMIETPPKNRYPIQTYITPRNDRLIKEAIEKEIARGGQIFYMYNHISDIEEIVLKLNRLVPDAKITFAHGQMNKNSLENIISSFIDHEYDVLVCTTIIETGIDIPDTNTLIVHDSDLLGLSQLYQLRGRVGRSDRIAYCYLMYEPRKILTKDAERRLHAIKEFTDLGSGYKIAMRDLSIRGAGDILGEEQSGFIDSIGIQLYLKILEDSLKEAQGLLPDTPKETINPNIFSNRFIEDEYIEDEATKIEIHNKIKVLSSVKELEKLQIELKDRFGMADENLGMYLYEKLFQNLSNKTEIEEVLKQNDKIVLLMQKERSQKMDGEKLFGIAMETSKHISLHYRGGKIYIEVNLKSYFNNSWLKDICNYLDKISFIGI